MDYEQVKELIKQLEESSLTELELRLGGDYVRLSKNSGTLIRAEQPEAVKALTEPVSAPIRADKQSSSPIESELVRSPLVGTFYASPSPDKAPFVKPGDKVKPGDVLCIVEAMKLMNEITAKTSGVVAEIYPENESMVEYNQPLIRITAEG